MKIIVVLCTVPDQECAEQLAQIVLEARLAACVSYLPPMTSLYHWQGVIQRQTEIQMLLKTDSQRQSELLIMIKKHHPYQLPELLAWLVDTAEAAYAAWLVEGPWRHQSMSLTTQPHNVARSSVDQGINGS